MSIYKDGKLIAGGRQTMPLLSFMWADHQLNDISWLRADTFSWQAGSVYQAVYQHLAGDIDGKTLQSETISGTTIQFYLADDGHKICPASEESNVSAIYNSTGVAWYYILDTANQRFKLPRTKWGFTGLRDGVGNYVAPGLPNITGYIAPNSNVTYGGAFYQDGNEASNGYGSHVRSHARIRFDASRSSSIYGASNTVQPKATEMYLYFYVGNFTQTALENTAGLNAELFNGKADVSTVAHVVTEFQAPTAENNYTWYRKYADGWVEQGGVSNGLNAVVTLPVEMADTNYTLICSGVYEPRTNTSGANWSAVSGYRTSTTTITLGQALGFATMGWQVSGKSAQ